ncbi:MAG: hypothetical protein S0880_03405, partial [Actinomycetota bacterium]|nr:hypothetical protein [Actinomycetota bacterium]
MDFEAFKSYLVGLFADADQGQAFVDSPVAELEARGFGGVSPADLHQALAEVTPQLAPQTRQAVETSVANLSDNSSQAGGSIFAGDQVQQVAPAAAAAPTATEAAPAPAPIQEVIREIETHVTEVHETVVNREEVFVEGDTNIDNRVITDIEAEGDVELDQEVENTTATDGGVAAGDDIEDSAVNTGEFEGIQVGDGDVDAEDAVIGDGNTVIEDSEVGAFATGGGDA